MLLFVCHANICRSPMAERLARLDLTEHAAPGVASTIGTASAGTHARSGDGMHPAAAQVLRELGADTSDFSSRPVSAELVAQASLVLTATREQRAICVRLAPVALRRTFTIRQLGRLAAALDPATVVSPRTGRVSAPERITAVLARIAIVRGALQPAEPDDDDLVDPVNGTEDDVRACARQIQLALRPVLALIGAA